MQKKSPAILRPHSLRSALGGNTALLGLTTLGLIGSVPALAEEVFSLDTLQIEERTSDTNPYAEPGEPYKAKYSGDERHSRPLAETPQTINVLTQTQIQESGRSDLRDILQAQPGITLGTGENGNAFGDRYVIRGHEARSDVYIDGLRDPGMTTRESFAVEQVEVTKGPSSTFAGRGTTGGAINSVTKQASHDYDFGKLGVGLGSDAQRRLTLDLNRTLGDDLALRLNLLHAYEEVPERAPADSTRDGAALAIGFRPSERLEVKADFYHLRAEDIPDLGNYIRPLAEGGQPVDDLPAYAQEQDFLDTEVDVATLRLAYRVRDGLRVHNATRIGRTNNGYVTTGARGTTDTSGNPTVSLSTHQGWQEVEYLANHTNLFLDTELGGLNHALILGLTYTDEQVLNGVYNVSNSGASNCTVSGRGGASPGWCIQDANGNYLSNINSLMGRQISKGDWDADWRVKTTSLALMDTVDLNRELTLFAGVRVDRFDYSNTTQSGGTQTVYSYDDTLWNGHLGLVRALTPQGNLYLTYSTSSEINGGESDVGSSCGYGGVCVPSGDPEAIADSRPERAENIELGTKWNLNGERLLLTAALFQITKRDVMEQPSGDSYSNLGSLNTGANRVRGVELALAGRLTERLSAQAGVSLMRSEVLESITPANEGRALSNFADQSAYLQLNHQTTPKLNLGGSYTYASEMYAGQPDSAAGYDSTLGDYSYTIPAHSVVDLFASYQVNRDLGVRLNVGNVLDEDYYLAAYRSGAFAYKGDARNVRLTLDYAF